MGVRTRYAASLAALLIAFAASSTTARGEQYAAAPLNAVQVLDKAKDARGELRPGTFVEVRNSHGSGLDTTSTTFMSGNDYVTRDKTGPFTSASGSYRGQHWRQDENGLVVLSSQFRSKVDPNVLAWKHPENPAYNVRVLGITTTAPPEYVVEANPPGGSDQYRYYDAKTFLLERVVTYAKDRHRHVVTYSDYRTVFGATVAFQTTSGDGRPQNDDVERVVSFAPAGASSVSLAIPDSRPLFTIDKPVELPARFTRAGIVVRVTIGGRALDFLLDSGASEILIDPGVAHGLGIQAQGRFTATIGGDFDMSLAAVPQMSVGELQMHDVAVHLGPIDQYVDGSRVVGLLGFDFLASAIPCIDFKNGRVTLYPRAALIAQSSQLQAMPMMVDDAVPRVPVNVENVQGWFLLDTGAFATMMYNEYLSKLRNTTVADERVGRISAVGGSVRVRPYTVTDFAFGAVLFRSADVLVPQESTFDMVDYDGIIGRDVLSSYQVWLDYTDRQAFVKYERP